MDFILVTFYSDRDIQIIFESNHLIHVGLLQPGLSLIPLTFGYLFFGVDHHMLLNLAVVGLI